MKVKRITVHLEIPNQIIIPLSININKEVNLKARKNFIMAHQLV